MNILLPIETINREFDFKIVLSSLLAGNGNRVYIGQHDFLMKILPKLRNGLYIGKNIFHKRSDIEDGKIYKDLKSKGFNIIYLHEEGAVFKGGQEIWRKTLSRQYNLDFFDNNDVICDWGSFQKKYDESRSSTLKIEVTGHPRFDLYKKQWRSYFQKEVEEIQKVHSKYVLINGNYGLYNHGLGLEFVFSAKAGYNPDDCANRMDKVDFITYSGSQCLSMVQITHRLSIEYPETNFVYRPHPSENQSFYNTVFRGVKNISVDHKGSVSAWILGSQAIIHDGCTTALEASLAGKPVINYKPVENIENDIWLPNQLGIRCVSFQDVKNVLDNINQYTFDIDKLESKDQVKALIDNFESNSYEKLLSIIDKKILDNKNIKSDYPTDSFIAIQYSKMKSKQYIFKLKDAKSKKASAYHSRKFYGFDKVYLEEKIKTLEKMLDKKVDLKYHNPYLIEIK